MTLHRRQIIIKTNDDSVHRLVIATQPEWVNFLFPEAFNHFRHWNFHKWNGLGVKRTRALGQNETPLGWNVMVPFCPIPFCPRRPFCPNIPCSLLPWRLRLEKSHYVNYNIARCSIKLCENEKKRYMIISNHMQPFCYLICQSNWCPNVSKLIYHKGEIMFLWY